MSGGCPDSIDLGHVVSCAVCAGYSDWYQDQLEIAGLRYRQEMERIRELEAQGKPIEHVHDSIAYHEAWARSVAPDE